MLVRVVLSGFLAGLPAAAQAIQPAPLLPARGLPLPYDLTGFVVEPQRPPAPPTLPPQPEPAPPQIAAHAPLADEGDDETILLVYDLAGFLPPYPRRPTGAPLRYELDGLLGAGSP